MGLRIKGGKMKTNLLKKAVGVLLAVALTAGSVWGASGQSKAAENDYVNIYSSGWKTVSAGEEQTYEFNVKGNKQTYAIIYSFEAVPGTVTYYKDGEYEIVMPIQKEDWTYSELNGTGYYCWGDKWSTVTDSSYKVVVSFDSDAYYDLEILRDADEKAAISNTKLTLTEGFSHKLSVTNVAGEVSWSTDNKKVATVSSKGVVNGKKSGSATITAKLSDGTKLTCKVSVKKNVYSRSKLPVSSVTYGKTGVDIYKISYDKKGNLVLKANILNNSYHTDTKLKNLKITIKTLEGKTVATYSAKNIKLNIKAGAKKGMTFTIKKKKVKIKKADLRNINTPRATGTVIYKRF